MNPEDVINAIRFRRSIRSFQETKIPKEVIQQILEAGRFTDTAAANVSHKIKSHPCSKREKDCYGIGTRLSECEIFAFGSP